MIKISDKTKCSGCHACASICPKKCIFMEKDEEGFLYPCVNEENCIKCGFCVKACPIITPNEKTKTEDDIVAYGAYSKNDDVRKNSSSGGIFTLIAEQIINDGGVVFGAAFNSDFTVSHQYSTTIEGLARFRGSKYVQSTIGNTYEEAKKLLNQGTMVLFTGTPCQIGGLYSYLGKTYNNLITQDIICHGVSSPAVWQAYLKQRMADAGTDTVKEVYFKDKRTGWKTYSMSIKFDNGKEYSKKSAEDLMMRSFIGNYCLRQSCYDCDFKNKIRESDITLADFWGGNRIVPHMDDDKGLSLVIVNSKKGKEIFEKIATKVVSEQVQLDESISHNSSMLKSSSLPPKRDAFMKEIQINGFDKTANKYLKKPFLRRIISKFKRIIKKVFKI